MRRQRMRKTIRELVRVGVAHISKVRASILPCFDVFNRSHDTGQQNIELMGSGESGKDRGFTKCRGKSRSCCKERMRCSWNVCAIHIGPSLVYLAVGQVTHITVDYTATSDSYSTFVTAHFC